MSPSQIITTILNNEGITAAQLSKDMGDKRPQALYDILNGKAKSITPKMADKIRLALPKYSRDWLLTGNGEMFTDNIDDIPVNTLNTTNSIQTINKLINIIARKDEELSEMRKQLTHLTECFQKLVEYYLPANNTEKEAM